MSSPSAGKRRMDTDVIKLIESKHEVTILGGLNEFCVKFYGPRGTPYEGGLWKNVKNCIIDNGFQVVKSTRTTITKQQAGAFYSEHKGRFFYNRLITFMCSGPSEIYILAREDAIRTWRELMGPTKVYQAVYSAPHTIRANYGLSDTRNATHGSDSMESALREIKVFFPCFNYEKWMTEDEPYFSSGKVRFDEENFVHHALKS